MKRIAFLVFVLIVSSAVNAEEPNVQAINFVTLSGRVLGSDSQPIVNAKIFSDEAFANRVLTCTGTDGTWNLDVPATSAQRYVYVWLTPKLTGNNNIDCEAPTTGAIPTLGCWTTVGPFVATADRIINFDVAPLQSRTLRIVDGDGFPFYGARIGDGGQSGSCPVSSPNLATQSSFMNNAGDGDTDMDGLITVVGATPFGKTINIVNGSATVTVNMSSLDQRVELPVRQSLPSSPIVTFGNPRGNPLIEVSANSRDAGLSKFTVKLSDGSSICTIALRANATQGFCFMTDWIRNQTYDFVISAWNGKGEGSPTLISHTTPGWNTTSTSTPVPNTSQSIAPATNLGAPRVIAPTVTSPTMLTPTLTSPTVGTPALKISGSIAARSLASLAKLKVVSTSTVKLKVVSTSSKYCKVTGTTLKGLKTGSCKVTVTVTPKKGRATSKTVSLKVMK